MSGQGDMDDDQGDFEEMLLEELLEHFETGVGSPDQFAAWLNDHICSFPL